MRGLDLDRAGAVCQRVVDQIADNLIEGAAVGQRDASHSLGAQAGEEPVRRLAADAGFTGFRRVAETPFNIVYEARP